MTDTTSFLVVLAAAAAAPVAADIASRARAGLVVPVAVAEILLGALVGPDVLGLTERGEILDFLNQLGLGFLFFFACYEIEFHRIAGAPLRLALLGWLLTLVLAYGLPYRLRQPGWSSPACSSAPR
jgi:Kef-type K+ transport system membrane component KefB